MPAWAAVPITAADRLSLLGSYQLPEVVMGTSLSSILYPRVLVNTGLVSVWGYLIWLA